MKHKVQVGWLTSSIVNDLQKYSLDNPVKIDDMQDSPSDEFAKVLEENTLIHGNYRITVAIMVPAVVNDEAVIQSSDPFWVASAEFLDPTTREPVVIRRQCSAKIQHKMFLCCAIALERVGVGQQDRGGILADQRGWIMSTRYLQLTKMLTDDEKEIVAAVEKRKGKNLIVPAKQVFDA